MKTTIKAVLFLALLCGTAVADDGDMGNGGFWSGDTSTTTAPTMTTSNDGDGNMGNGGKTCPQGQTNCLASDTNESLSIFGIVANYLAATF